MTLNYLILKLWYSANILILSKEQRHKHGAHLELNEIKKDCLYCGEAHGLRSAVNEHLLFKEVKSYGIIDNIFIIEVY